MGPVSLGPRRRVASAQTDWSKSWSSAASCRFASIQATIPAPQKPSPACRNIHRVRAALLFSTASCLGPRHDSPEISTISEWALVCHRALNEPVARSIIRLDEAVENLAVGQLVPKFREPGAGMASAVVLKRFGTGQSSGYLREAVSRRISNDGRSWSWPPLEVIFGTKAARKRLRCRFQLDCGARWRRSTRSL